MAGSGGKVGNNGMASVLGVTENRRTLGAARDSIRTGAGGWGDEGVTGAAGGSGSSGAEGKGIGSNEAGRGADVWATSCCG